MKSGPRSPQLEKALAQKRRPNTAKYINKKKKKKMHSSRPNSCNSELSAQLFLLCVISAASVWSGGRTWLSFHLGRFLRTQRPRADPAAVSRTLGRGQTDRHLVYCAGVCSRPGSPVTPEMIISIPAIAAGC